MCCFQAVVKTSLYVNQLSCGKISLSSFLLIRPTSPVPSKGSESMVRLLAPNHPWQWQPPQSNCFQHFPIRDCSPALFPPVIPKVNPPAVAVGRRALEGTSLDTGDFGAAGGTEGPGRLQNQNHHRKTLNVADARCADKLPEHHVEPARGDCLKPAEWKISWPLTNIILR